MARVEVSETRLVSGGRRIAWWPAIVVGDLMAAGSRRAVFGQPSSGFLLIVFGAGRGCESAWGGKRLEALERVQDRVSPGPVRGEVKCVAARVSGEVAGDVQDPVAQAFGL